MRKILLFSLFILLAGCYPDGPEYTDELDSVYTNYSPDFNFSQPLTYSLPDGVIDVDGNPDNSPVFIDTNFSDAIISSLKSNLNAQGWTEVDENDDPDVVVLAAAMDSNFLYYSVDWWGWYYPGHFPGWGWYYPGYYPTYISGFSVGTIVIQMTSPSGITGNQVPVEWVCVINGLLEGTDAYIIDRIDANIDQAFMQSPFNN